MAYVRRLTMVIPGPGELANAPPLQARPFLLAGILIGERPWTTFAWHSPGEQAHWSYLLRAPPETWQIRQRAGGMGTSKARARYCSSAFDSTLEEVMTSTHDVTVTMMEQVLDAFNRHDLDTIMTFFAEDSTLEMPRGKDPWGTRLVGKAAVREGLASRFAGIPDVHYSEDRHFVCGDRGVSEWLLTGTTTGGQQIAVRGCDLWEFRDGQITRKDSYWKIVE